MPDEIELKEDDFLVPFPFILDSSVINPCLSHKKIIKKYLSNASRISENELKVIVEIVSLYPNSVDETYFMSNLDRLID